MVERKGRERNPHQFRTVAVKASEVQGQSSEVEKLVGDGRGVGIPRMLAESQTVVEKVTAKMVINSSIDNTCPKFILLQTL